MLDFGKALFSKHALIVSDSYEIFRHGGDFYTKLLGNKAGALLAFKYFIAVHVIVLSLLSLVGINQLGGGLSLIKSEFYVAIAVLFVLPQVAAHKTLAALKRVSLPLWGTAEIVLYASGYFYVILALAGIVFIVGGGLSAVSLASLIGPNALVHISIWHWLIRDCLRLCGQRLLQTSNLVDIEEVRHREDAVLFLDVRIANCFWGTRPSRPSRSCAKFLNSATATPALVEQVLFSRLSLRTALRCWPPRAKCVRLNPHSSSRACYGKSIQTNRSRLSRDCGAIPVAREGETSLLKSNVIGLKLIVPLFFFPCSIAGWNFALAFRHATPDLELDISLKNISGDQLGSFKLTGAQEGSSPQALEGVPLTSSTAGTVLLMMLPEAWNFFTIRWGTAPNAVVLSPGRYFLTLKQRDDSEKIIGEFGCVLVDPAPLTVERIAAIRSDPRAINAIRIRLECNKCYDGINAYAALEHIEQLEREGYIWYQNLPDAFTCRCKITTLDLSSVKRNLYAPLGSVNVNDPLVASTPLYELSTLHNLYVEFTTLLNTNSREELLQQFLQDNPILFRQFPATEIFFKPSILTFFDADFAILTPNQELILSRIFKT